jgi:hypothetical protein
LIRGTHKIDKLEYGIQLSPMNGGESKEGVEREGSKREYDQLPTGI